MGVEGFAEQRPLPLFFVANRGQTQSAIHYLVETPELRAGFERDAVVFQVHGRQMRVRFRGSSARLVSGENQLPGYANFFTGNDPAGWRTGLPTYGGLIYRDLYSGVDLHYAGAEARIKSEFTVAPGADPRQIVLEYPGAVVSIRDDGSLLADAGTAQLTEEPPYAYQDTPHGRVAIEAHYTLGDHGAVGFALGSYDAARALVIDPVISYSTYLGGSGLGAVTGIAVDSSGNAYATGWTESLDFPIAGAVQAANQGGVDTFVVKFNSAGSALLYATYLGGRGDDRGAGIAVDSAGEAWVTGATGSTNFPLVQPVSSILGGGKDAFVVKLSASGSNLLFSTYLGGTNYDLGTAIALDPSGNAYVAGDTLSANFPNVLGAQAHLGGKTDAFVTKFLAAGTLAWSTFLGGSNDDHAGGVAVDANGNAWIAGSTTSADFPVLGGFQSTLNGGQDAFVAKIQFSTSAELAYSTYLGGSGGGSGWVEQANAIAVDSSGAAYVAGVTNSSNFPTTSGAFQTSFSGQQDVFVSKIAAGGSTLVYSTYLGGTSFDWASGIALDASRNAYVTGYTSSLGFPVANAVQAGFNGFYDAFVTELNASGNTAVFSTFYGGTGSDLANAIAVDAGGNLFLGGQTASPDFPLVGQIQSSNAGGSTGWVARLGVSGAPQGPSADSLTPSAGGGNTATFTAQYSDTAGANSLTSVSLLVNTTANPDFGCYVVYTPSTNRFTLFNDLASTGGFTVTPGTGGSQQNTQCSLKGLGTFASLSGQTLTLTVSITFLPPFPGTKTVYLAAADASSSTGWVARGSFNVVIPAAQPTVGSVTVSGSTFSVVYSDSQNVNNITGVGILINTTSGSTVNSCELYFDRNANTIELFWDNIAASTARPLSSSTPLTNSQCIVGNVTATVSGLSVVLTANIVFKSAFTGQKTIYGWAADGYTNTGWVPLSPYTVTVGGVPVANAVVPSAGSGPSQRFTFTVSDQGGSYFIKFIGILFQSSLNFNNACYLKFDPSANTVSVEYDIAGTGATNVIPGSNQIATSSQCVLQGANTQIVTTSTAVVITVDITFTASFAGNKVAYLYAGETAANSGWVAVGNWTATGGSPTADSMSPSSGAGNWQTFTFTASDSASQLNINGMEILFTTGSPANTVNQCHLVYNRGNSTIGLYNDADTVLGTKGIGYSTQLFNNQCWVGFTVMTTSGNSVNFTIELQFKPAFNGPKSVYIEAKEIAANSGWVSRGSWTVQ